jgi:P27 family predicted phage terminase small subunit
MAETSLPCPGYLGGALARRWEELAPELVKMGTLDALNADLLAKFILAENEYLKISERVQGAINGGDGDEAGKWINAQAKLSGQILKLGAELGITPGARRALGLGRR